MRITVLYFGAVREIVGQGEQELEVPIAVRSVADLALHVVELHAALAGRLASVRWAQNEEFVDMNAVLGAGDIIAILPPVAGG
jgi:molybdopterin synthase sulfur carrier subunit